MAFAEPVGINILGGIKINALENTASISIGENFYQAMDSQVKNNFINGNTFGDFDVMNLMSLGSIVIDPDGIDTQLNSLMSPLGLDD